MVRQHRVHLIEAADLRVQRCTGGHRGPVVTRPVVGAMAQLSPVPLRAAGMIFGGFPRPRAASPATSRPSAAIHPISQHLSAAGILI